MSLSVHPFTGCCTIKIITGFGGATVVGNTARQETMSNDQIEQQLNNIIEQQRAAGMAILTAAINSNTLSSHYLTVALPVAGGQRKQDTLRLELDCSTLD